MANRIIDCCSLINLYTGWRGLHELQALGHTWYVAEAALKEAQYTRDVGEGGRLVTIALRLDDLVQSGELNRAAAETAEEMELYVELSAELDDGEAEALAIAKARGLILLTDDAKAIEVAHRPQLSVQTLSTVNVLQEWLSSDPSLENRAHEVVRRIETLARFRPRIGTDEFEWWMAIRGQ